MGDGVVSRRKRWKDDPWRIAPFALLEDDDDPLQAAWKERIANPKRPRKSEGFSTIELTRASKEIIYCREEDGSNAFAYVVFAMDLGTAEMAVEELLTGIDLDHNEILRTLGIAHTYGVPVVPDTDDLAPQLEAWERELFTEGFTVDSEEKSGTRLVLSQYADVDIDSMEVLDAIERTKPITPSEARVVLSSVRRELGLLAETKRALDSLRSAIRELGELLADDETDEHQLQRCLTRNPIIFGPEYVQIHPKFRLGGDFEMDFALQRGSGLIDLVEIEAASHELFNKRGDPRAALVHAEQQVLDWLDWIDRYGDLARRDVPQMQRPVGYVVIGRDRTLSETSQRRLRQRNAVLGLSVEVMTYDGLLERAGALMRHFERLRDDASSD
jgi:hypothetical protein